MKQGTPISLQDFTDDLRHRLRGAWRAVEGVDPGETLQDFPERYLFRWRAEKAQAYAAHIEGDE
eukprot:1154211-Pelagomonas_calceolata.AAC.1